MEQTLIDQDKAQKVKQLHEKRERILNDNNNHRIIKAEKSRLIKHYNKSVDTLADEVRTITNTINKNFDEYMEAGNDLFLLTGERPVVIGQP